MSRKPKGLSTTGVSNKLLEALPTGYAERAEAMNSAGLKQEVFHSNVILATNKKDMKENQEIVDKKEDLKELMAPYKETAKMENAKVAFCIAVLKGRGQDQV